MPEAVGESPAGDASLAEAVKAGGVTMVERTGAKLFELKDGVETFEPNPFGRLTGDAPVAISVWDQNFHGYAFSTDLSPAFDGLALPSVAAAAVKLEGNEVVYPALGRKPVTAVMLSGPDLFGSDEALSGLTNRIVILSNLGSTTTEIGYWGSGRQPSVFLDMAAIASIRENSIVGRGWLGLVLLFGCLALLAQSMPTKRTRVLLLALPMLAVFLFPLAAESFGWWVMPGPAIVGVIVFVIGQSMRYFRQNVRQTSGSGLPNVEALVSKGIAPELDVIVCAIARYEQMLASLPKELHGECARQIARRLAVGSGIEQIYDCEGGQFAWLSEARPLTSQKEHLEGLRALFSAPLIIGTHTLDTNIHFGVDRNGDQSASTRINAALAAVVQAGDDKTLMREFEQSQLVDTPWQLSLHARIDEALHNGDIWLAYQPQLDLRSGRIGGAETLIRWTDPDRGAIPPDSFILQAERAGRIEALTFWVLEQTIRSGHVLERRFGQRMNLSVNLSAQVIEQAGFVEAVERLVKRNHTPPSSLTFEVTETFGLRDRSTAKENLIGLRECGFRLSIDDFGTGEAGLTYLAEIASDELKLDRRFISGIVTSQRERTITRAMIGLAHDLNQEVVAEGIEDLATLEALRMLGCDVAQGYYVGRPMAFDGFVASLETRGVATGTRR